MLLSGELTLAYIIFDTVKYQRCFKCSHSNLKPFFNVKIYNHNHFV